MKAKILLPLLLVALYIMLLLPKLSAVVGFIITGVLLVSLFVTHYIMMTTQGMWLQLMMPTLLLIGGHVLLTTKRFFLSEKGKARLDVESAESNRMLGLSLQGQGQLDAAFDKFRRLPDSPEKLELLYNLALDFERKRQFNKAKSVYDYIGDHDAAFRDIGDRSDRASAMEQTMKAVQRMKPAEGDPEIDHYLNLLIGKNAFQQLYGLYQLFCDQAAFRQRSAGHS